MIHYFPIMTLQLFAVIDHYLRQQVDTVQYCVYYSSYFQLPQNRNIAKTLLKEVWFEYVHKTHIVPIICYSIYIHTKRLFTFIFPYARLIVIVNAIISRRDILISLNHFGVVFIYVSLLLLLLLHFTLLEKMFNHVMFEQRICCFIDL